jgi:hypothetical protein
MYHREPTRNDSLLRAERQKALTASSSAAMSRGSPVEQERAPPFIEVDLRLGGPPVKAFKNVSTPVSDLND